MATFHLINFGCRASQADGAAIKQQLRISGLGETLRADQCEIAVLNTCTVTSAADAEVRQTIRRIRRTNPKCRVLVTGCYAQRAAQEIASLPGVEWVIGNSHKHIISEVLLGKRSGGEDRKSETTNVGDRGGLIQICSTEKNSHPHSQEALRDIASTPNLAPTVLVGEIAGEFHFAPVFPDDMTRPTLKVQDGCDARCSFCIIPDVRGPSRSLEPDIVIAQIRELEEKGYKEIVLSGINLGAYGKDLERRTSFQRLVEMILAKTSIPRIRISSIEPMDVTPDLVGLVAREARMARHFHVPLQSGCDRILRVMNRRYWASHYAERILAIHEQIPNCGIGADVMVGFPGETLDDHQASLHFIESLPFTYLHVFPYSSRPDTPAATRSDHLNGRVIHERGQEVRTAMARKRAAFLEAQLGRDLPAVVLADEEAGARIALSTNYLRLLLPGTEATPNTLVDVKVGRLHGGTLYGYAAEPARAPGNPLGGHR